jgi:aarF domain-containing kinase
VAVKVQRPGALEHVALDIFIMRRAAQLFSKLPGMSEKWGTALDDWALRFFMVRHCDGVWVENMHALNEHA